MVLRARLLGAALVALPSASLLALSALGTDSAFAGSLRRAAGLLCHQDPARSFAGFPFCHRCTGIYAGLALGGLLAARLARPVPFTLARYWAVAIGPLLAQVALGLALPAADHWLLRLLTGLLFGALAGLATAQLVAGLTRSVAGAPASPR